MRVGEKKVKNEEKCIFLENSFRKIWWNRKNVLPLHSHLRNNVC